MNAQSNDRKGSIESITPLSGVQLMTNPAFVVLILLVIGIFLPANAVRGQTGATVAYPISTGGNPLRRHIPSQGGNLAISGYDPVAYFIEGRAVEGNDEFEFLYANARWHFSSRDNLDAFADDPESYLPQYGGFCTVCMIEHSGLFDSNPKIWTIVKGKLYLNYDVRTRQKFRQNSGSYIQLADEIWASLTPAPETLKGATSMPGTYKIAIVPFGTHNPSVSLAHDVESAVTEGLKSYIRNNASFEVTYSYDAAPSRGPDISRSQVWPRGLRPQEPDLEFARKLSEQLGVQSVVTAWYRNTSAEYGVDRAQVELYVTDVSQGIVYREKGFVSEIDELVQKAFSAFIAGRQSIPTYKIAIFPLGTLAIKRNWALSDVIEDDLMKGLKSYIQDHASLEVAYSYYAPPSGAPEIPVEKVWLSVHGPQGPDINSVTKFAEKLGVQYVATAWFDTPDSTEFGPDRARVELYVTDVSQGIIYREKGVVSEIDEMAQRAFSEFIAGLGQTAMVNPFDGKWQAELKKQFGEQCVSFHSFDFSVTDGQLSGKMRSTLGWYLLRGSVAPDGRMVEAVLEGGSITTLEGIFSGDQATGNWETITGISQCSGKFEFTRLTGP